MNTIFDISDKVCVVTGGTGVLGGTVSKYLLEQKAIVIVLDLNKERLDKMLDDLGSFGKAISGYVCNVLDENQVAEISKTILEKHGKVNVLLNAAGGNDPEATIGEDQSLFDMNIKAFNKVGELNLNGTLIPSMAFGKIMADQGNGVIINYSSMTVLKTITRVVGYSASKAAVTNLTMWMATEFALKYGDGVRVNAIAPGFFIGNQNRKLLLNDDSSLTKRGQKIIDNTPMKRFGEAEELNGVIHWLISDAASFVTGVNVPIDGGFNVFSGV